MLTLAHHIEIGLFGFEYAAHSTAEHVMVLGITALVLAASGYGVYALIRDVRRMKRRGAEHAPQ